MSKTTRRNSVHKRMLCKAIIRAQEQERNRIGTELHDNVQQLLVTIKLHIGLARKNSCCIDDSLQKAEEYTDIAIQAIRKLSGKLASTKVIHLGLAFSIQSIFAIMSCLQIKVHADICPAVIEKLSADQQLMVFRIVQEQTNNILKHAEATEVTISLKERDGSVILLVSDNGNGFDVPVRQTDGFGFINIVNRATALDGTAEIISSPGEGCKVVVRFPFHC